MLVGFSSVLLRQHMEHRDVLTWFKLPQIVTAAPRRTGFPYASH